MMTALQGMERPFALQHVRQISTNLAVATVRIGPVTVGQVWVAGLTDMPEILWPQIHNALPAGWPA